MTLLIVFAIVIAAVAFVGETLGHSRSPSGAATITVTGSGTVTGTPNTVSFQIGVSTTAAQRQRGAGGEQPEDGRPGGHAAQERHHQEKPADVGTQHLRQHQLGRHHHQLHRRRRPQRHVARHRQGGGRHRRRGQGRRQRHPTERHHVLDLQPVEVPRGRAGSGHP